jgi:lipoprotein-anchoring transpeptidase ErfK/SrfK
MPTLNLPKDTSVHESRPKPSITRRATTLGVLSLGALGFGAPPAAFAAEAVSPVPATTPVLPDAVAAPGTAPGASGTASSAAASSNAATTPPAGGWKPPVVTVVAAARNRLTPVYQTATAAKPFASLDNRKNFSGRHVFLVLAQEGNAYRVQIPMRPNGRTGYVRASDVTLYQHDYAMFVDLSEHTLIVYKGGKEIQREVVAVGTAKYPTPTGSFFLRELAKPGNPRGAYGPWAFGLSAYSNVLQTFGRGDGQIGVHGTNQPGALGTNASHGCIRMKNASITKLAKTLPQGVPIEITP